MSFDDALQTFLAESREMLEEMENYLLDVEANPDDPQLLDALFRCVHTVKGSAGLFGFDHVVEFTHVVENVLDRLRGGQVRISGDLAALLLRSRDHIATLVEIPADDLDKGLESAGHELTRDLSIYQEEEGHSSSTMHAPATVEEGGCTEREGSGDQVANETWHISVRFNHDVLRNGMDPLGFIRYLRTLGEIRNVTTIADGLPEIADFDPESCYLGFEIDLQADTSKAEIEEVFEFVRDDSELFILPPRSEVDHYMEMIDQLPEDDTRLGEILLASGALTSRELEIGLERQQRKLEEGGGSRLGEVLVESKAADSEIVNAALSKQQQGREGRAKTNQYIRVQADRLDSLINLVGELVIASAAAGLSARRNGDTATQEAVATVSSLVEEIRDGSLDLRMVPIGETFQRFQRVVRDVSRELGKDIRLDITGADTELDKTVVEKIADPLTHLVRNAIDHGIESAERRAEAGKPLQGAVRLNAFHGTGSIIIEVSDDGGGLNRDRIIAKAVERELVQQDQELTDREVFNLIFEPGFSTADAVSNLSGRGVGMDVVKRNIEALRGSVEVESGQGEGTVFRIQLPLTLAIIDGFLTGVSDSSFVVPLDSVVECIELTSDQRQEINRRNFVNLRGEVLPVVKLREWFELDGEPGKRENIVVMAYGDKKAGLIVDELMGEYQTVIKPLGKLFSSLNGISGSTILGSGEVALILDVASLIHEVGKLESGVYSDSERDSGKSKVSKT